MLMKLCRTLHANHMIVSLEEFPSIVARDLSLLFHFLHRRSSGSLGACCFVKGLLGPSRAYYLYSVVSVISCSMQVVEKVAVLAGCKAVLRCIDLKK